MNTPDLSPPLRVGRPGAARTGLLLSLLLALLATFAVAPNPASAAESVEVSGRVVALPGTTGIGSVKVEALKADDPSVVVATATSNETDGADRGKYSLNVPTGKYVFRAFT